jgi:hypothetical protein
MPASSVAAEGARPESIEWVSPAIRWALQPTRLPLQIPASNFKSSLFSLLQNRLMELVPIVQVVQINSVLAG